jgi:error-prone DNA polymerase
MALLRSQLPHVTRACDLSDLRHGQPVIIAGMVICRQRPGTAKGNVFISLEDETGIANAFVRSEVFERLRLVITHEHFLEIEGTLQSLENVISVLAREIRALDSPALVEAQSHDFH